MHRLQTLTKVIKNKNLNGSKMNLCFEKARLTTSNLSWAEKEPLKFYRAAYKVNFESKISLIN